MADLIEIREKLHDTNAEISRLRRTIAQHPEQDEPLLLMLKSLERRQQSLERSFLAAADRIGVDVCSYRLSPVEQNLSAWNMASVLEDFQRWFSVLFDAIKSGPKHTAHLTADALSATTLNFGYSFPGSVGLVFTVPSERLLLGETALERTASTIAEMASARSPEKIREFANEYGPAPVKAMYNWAKHHAQAGLGAQIEWWRGETIRSRMFVQQGEFEALQSALEQTGETTTETVELPGFLCAADVTNRTFRLLLDDDTIIKGSFEDAIDESHAVTIPKRYRATLKQRTTVQYSSVEDRIEYFLESLHPLH